MRQGVILDCGRHETGNGKKTDDDWWLDLYVMLSRATRLDDLLLVRAPDLQFFLKGPPKSLASQLQKFAKRTEKCRATAAELARELGDSNENLTAFLGVWYCIFPITFFL